MLYSSLENVLFNIFKLQIKANYVRSNVIMVFPFIILFLAEEMTNN